VANKDLTQIEGFPELNRKLKQLPDRVKRTEVLKIFKKLAKPFVQAYSQALPVGSRNHSRTVGERSGKESKRVNYTPGNLAKSVTAVTVPAGKVGGNPAIAIRPWKKGKDIDSYYRFMVIPKGTKTGSISRGSRKGKNTVVNAARNQAFNNTGAQARKQAEDKTAKYIQRQIDKLGNV